MPPVQKHSAPPKVGEFAVQWMPLSKVKRYINNPRTNVQAVSGVRRSLDQFGWRQPLVVDKHFVIVAGDTRYLAAMQRGDAQVPVHVASDLTDDQARAYRIADNKVAEASEWNDTKLMVEIAELLSAKFDLEDAGFSKEEIAEFTEAAPDNRHLEDFDLTPKPRPVWIMISTNQGEAAKIISTVSKLGLKYTRLETTLTK